MDASVVVLLAAAGGAIVGAIVAWTVACANAGRELAEQTRTAAERTATLQADLRHQREASTALKDLVDKADVRFRDAFGALAADALTQSNQAFLQLAESTFGKLQVAATGELEKRQKAVDTLVQPIVATLQQVDAKLQQAERDRVAASAALDMHLQSVARSQQMLQAETANLVRALRAPDVRGNWGEIQLRRVVEMAGMVEYCDYVQQETHDTDGGRLRPDLVVRLPGGKAIVVDAKVPMQAYLEAQAATDDGLRAKWLADHARQLRDHMKKLGAKAYWDQVQPAPEFVVLFLPGEMLFHAALQSDPQMIETGWTDKVVVASPITLIALLRTVASGWRQESIARNAQQISALGKELYERLRKMTEYFEKVGGKLEGAVEEYNRVVGTFESRVLVSARRFKDLEAAGGSEIESLDQIDTRPRALRAPELPDLPEAIEEPAGALPAADTQAEDVENA